MMKRRSIFFAFALAATAAAFAAMPDLQSPATAKVTFRGTEYLLRSSHGNGYDFTPRGQGDLSTFTDMLELNLYPTAHDQEALATITSRVQAVAQGAKATILRTISVSASGNNRASISLPQCCPPPMVWISMRYTSSWSTIKLSGSFIPTGPTASPLPARRVHG